MYILYIFIVLVKHVALFDPAVYSRNINTKVPL